MFAPVAESVDALDLKSNWAYNPVPVQVWPGAILKDSRKWVFFSYKIYQKIKNVLLISRTFFIIFHLFNFSSSQTMFSPRFSMFRLASSSDWTSPLSRPIPKFQYNEPGIIISRIKNM